jgi:hypothetical protein
VEVEELGEMQNNNLQNSPFNTNNLQQAGQHTNLFWQNVQASGQHAFQVQVHLTPRSKHGT